MPPPSTSKPLVAGTEAAGTLATPGERDLYQIDVPATFSVVQVQITHANTRCEVWGSLSDLDGTVLGRAFVVGSEPNTVTALVAAAGPIFLTVDDGPLASCAGGSYRLLPAVGELPQATLEAASPAPAGSAAARPASVSCYCWSKRAEQLSTKIRRTTGARNRAKGAKRRRLTRKLAHLRAQYRAARRETTNSCAG